MHDLRKRALLESGKTTSRKARSKPQSARSSQNHSPIASPAHSRAGSRLGSRALDRSPITSPGHSRAGSRVGSRPGSPYGSDDELDWDENDFMTPDTFSADGDNWEEEEENENDWVHALRSWITELQDRKNSSASSRQQALTAYNRILSHHVAERELESSASDMITALVKTVRAAGDGTECSLALRALALTVFTWCHDVTYTRVNKPVRTACEDAEGDSAKIEAVRALGIASVYGGADDYANEDLLEFLLDIIESDGQSVGADDSCAVVEAALQTWAFVAAYEDDLSNIADRAMEAFTEQLDSGDADVQTGAGCDIALLFENLRAHEEETGQSHDLQHNQHRALTRISEIMKQSSKASGRRDRQTVRSNLSSVVTSLERGVGPGYSTAVRPEFAELSSRDVSSRHEYGYRERYRVGNAQVVIDSWSLKAKIEAHKALLGGGFSRHMMENPNVNECLGRPKVEEVVNRGKNRKDTIKALKLQRAQ